MNVRLLSNHVETPTTRRIRLSLDGGRFSYRAGQSASLSAGGLPTPYSIASAPAETARHGWLEFLVKVDGSSRFGALVDTLLSDARVDLDGPSGLFTLDSVAPGTPVLFIAGGTGIAPVRSMIRETVESGHDGRPLALLYSSRTPDEFAYLSELKELATAGHLTLTLTLTGDAQGWAHARGRAGIAHLAELVRDDTTAFICGPPSMVGELRSALASLGVGSGRIVTENW
ncbi:MAG TPA: FAD-dependent oxidoreductase [Vicinamibacterales bacterium]|jgi:ferredoxin-NADP reductase|nr:FAD-dependent oxidoreductase [Vicinamibacterales bacterium]